MAARNTPELAKANSRLLKLSSAAGQDLRSPFAGVSPKFPTEDSKTFAAKSLRQSSAEVGPAPRMKSPSGPDVKSLTPSMGTIKGDLPKIGADMSNKYENDPLVQYLRKHAESLETNIDKKVPFDNPPPLQKYDLEFTDHAKKKSKENKDEFLEKMFANRKK